MSTPYAGIRHSRLRDYRRLIPFVRPYWRLLALSAAITLVVTPLGLYWPYAMQEVVDRAPTDPTVVVGAIATIVLVLLVQYSLNYGQGVADAVVDARLGRDIRVALVDHLHRLGPAFLHERRSGEMVSLINADALSMHGLLTRLPLDTTREAVQLTGGLAAIWLMNWRLALVTAAVAIPLAFAADRLGRRLRDVGREGWRTQGEAAALLTASLAEHHTVQAFNRQSYESGRYRAALDAWIDQRLRGVRISGRTWPALYFLGFLPELVALAFAANELRAGRITAGETTALLLYVGMATRPVGALSAQWAALRTSLGAADRVFALLDARPVVLHRPGALALGRARGHVRFEGIDFQYPTSFEPTLAAITLEVTPGRTLALVGRSGAGKSTVLQLLLRFHDVSAGRITLDGTDIREIDLHSLRENIALVPQDPALFAGTILDNVRYGRLDAKDEEVVAALQAANALEFVLRLPDGIRADVGERGSRLSMGQRQRISIARAILRDAPILLLDEATASLDNASEALVQDALARLMRDRTTIVVAHRLTTIEEADEIVLLDRGRILERGTHAGLMSFDGSYRGLYTGGAPETVAAAD